MVEMVDLDLSNKRVLIREDLNVPLENGKVTNTKRIEAILPTLNHALKQGARIILMSHLDRPKEGIYDPHYSLAPVATSLENFIGGRVPLIKNINENFQVGCSEMVLLENIRFLTGEKENSPMLSQRLAELCDIFVMDAFATAHRKEASTYGVAEYAPIACAGPLLVSEINALQQIIKSPKKPLVAIVGGSKVSSKLPALKSLLTKVDYLIVGGGIANTFLAARGVNIGSSLYEEALIPEAKEMLAYAKTSGKLIIIPVDVVVASSFSQTAKAATKDLTEIKENDSILDVGPKTMEAILPIIAEAKTILWNGPLGVFEWDQFSSGTKTLAIAIAQSDAYSVAGGGDTLAAIDKYNIENDISYISTGGGAFLEFLEGKTLPAIEILIKRAQK